ncbi:MAG: dihydroorotate dehydrogenase [Defluviitaleaceae bacterium]|nr:dihydroorotate dehydrogenase [Defluviitaleaceae bacterium]
MDKNLNVNLAGVRLKNPIVTASGTFGSGREYSQFADLNRLGAVTVKGLSHEPWEGNPPHRIAETYGGMLNAVGLQNPGAKAFIAYELPFLKQYDTKIIVNLCGRTIEDYVAVTEDFAGVGIDLYELNISCPNVKAGGMAMGTDPKAAEAVTKAVVARANAPVIVKLSPNVTDIVSIAKACEAGGAAGISLINTLLGMKIDIHKKKPLLGNIVGGLSGPAIKPVALRMVYQVAKNTSLPILGMGGIMTWEDAIEFIMAGATAVAVGMANFANPGVTIDILQGIEEYMDREKISDINQIRGIAQ